MTSDGQDVAKVITLNEINNFIVGNLDAFMVSNIYFNIKNKHI